MHEGAPYIQSQVCLLDSIRSLFCPIQVGVTQYKRTGHWEAHVW